MRACSTLAVAMLVPCIALADPPEPAVPRSRATILVDVSAVSGTSPWIADAFEQVISRELSGFDRLEAVPKPAHTCGTDQQCKLRVYREARIQIVLFGRATDDDISYELYQTWTPARLATGSISIERGQTMIGLVHATRDALHPVLKHGGLLDQRPHAFELAASRTERSPSGDHGWRAREVGLLFAAIGLLVLPFGVLGVWVQLARRSRRKTERDPDASLVQRATTLVKARAGWLLAMRSARRVAGVAIAVALAIVVLDPRTIVELVASWPWVFAGLGGLAWGAFAVVVMRAVFPPLDGLARVGNYDLSRILGTWWLACVEQLVLVVLLALPFVWVATTIDDAFAIPAPWTIVLVAPLIAFAAKLHLASWVECFALALDRRHVDGVASRENPWSRELGDYLMGYVRRTGWDLEPELLGNVLLLPGKPGTGIVAYGGGTTHARIVIDKRLLELAMGPLVEVKPDEKPALWPDWTAAVVVVRSGHAKTRATTISVGDFRGRKTKPQYPGMQRKPLGQAATLLGHVLPQPGQVAPLISDNPKDLAVVRELLSEHYPWFAPDPDDEYDATDPTDKDFLFGAIAREIGVVRRHETQLQTLKLLFGVRAAGFGSRYRARLADSYAALNFARHHLIQYLEYARTGNEEHLTARANVDRLNQTTARIFARVRSSPAKRAERVARRRLVWLSRFFAQPIVDPRHVRYRKLGFAAFALAIVLGIGLAVKTSFDYSPVYERRIDAQQREVERLKKLKAEREERDRQKGFHGQTRQE